MSAVKVYQFNRRGWYTKARDIDRYHRGIPIGAEDRDGISTGSQGFIKKELKGAEDAYGIPSVDKDGFIYQYIIYL